MLNHQQSYSHGARRGQTSIIARWSKPMVVLKAIMFVVTCAWVNLTFGIIHKGADVKLQAFLPMSSHSSSSSTTKEKKIYEPVSCSHSIAHRENLNDPNS
eukprot:scaffold1036_cov276-Chaetoceros_neogracile.AAC.5